MAVYRLTAQADLGVMFDAEAILYPSDQLWPVSMHKQRFEQYCADSPSVGFEIDGIAVGGALYDGEHLHIAVLPDYYNRWGRLWLPMLTWLFSVADPVEARLAKSNVRCLRFAEKREFPRVAEDDDFVTYRLSSQTQSRTQRRIASCNANIIIERNAVLPAVGGRD